MARGGTGTRGRQSHLPGDSPGPASTSIFPARPSAGSVPAPAPQPPCSLQPDGTLQDFRRHPMAVGPGSGLFDAACSEPRGLASDKAARWGQAPAMPHVSAVPHTCSGAVSRNAGLARRRTHACSTDPTAAPCSLPSAGPGSPAANPVPWPDAVSPARPAGRGAQDTAVPCVLPCGTRGDGAGACCPLPSAPPAWECLCAGPTRHGWAVRGLRVRVRRQLARLLLRAPTGLPPAARAASLPGCSAGAGCPGQCRQRLLPSESCLGQRLWEARSS